MKKGYEKLFATNIFLKNKTLDLYLSGKEQHKMMYDLPDSRIYKMIENIKKEPRPMRKYCITDTVSKSILEKLKDVVSPENIGWFKKEYFKMMCEKYSGEVGFVYTNIENKTHFLYSIQENMIQIISFGGTKLLLEEETKTVNNIDGCFTIDLTKDNINSFNQYLKDGLRSNGFVGRMSQYSISIEEDHCYILALVNEYYDLAIKYGLNSAKVSKEEFSLFIYDMIKESAFHEKNKRLAINKEQLDDMGDFTMYLISLEAPKQFFLIYSLMMLIFIKLSDIKVETFDSILPKNKPTSFIDPNTGRRNQGVIIVDRLYDTEINIDCPFGVKGHWRNQYYGKDAAGNPIHKKIFIEAFEKKGYHRKATKELVENNK